MRKREREQEEREVERRRGRDREREREEEAEREREIERERAGREREREKKKKQIKEIEQAERARERERERQRQRQRQRHRQGRYPACSGIDGKSLDCPLLTGRMLQNKDEDERKCISLFPKKIIEFFRGAPEGATTLLHFVKCSRPFIRCIKKHPLLP